MAAAKAAARGKRRTPPAPAKSVPVRGEREVPAQTAVNLKAAKGAVANRAVQKAKAARRSALAASVGNKQSVVGGAVAARKKAR